VELEICGVNTAFGVFDENIDQDKRNQVFLKGQDNDDE
jgi:hypothetical protein